MSDLLGDNHARGVRGGDALARSTVRVSVQPDVSVVAVILDPGIEVARRMQHTVAGRAQLLHPLVHSKDAKLLVDLHSPVGQVVLLREEFIGFMQTRGKPRDTVYGVLHVADAGARRLALKLTGKLAEALLQLLIATTQPDALTTVLGLDAVADDDASVRRQLMPGVGESEAHLVTVVAGVRKDLVHHRAKNNRRQAVVGKAPVDDVGFDHRDVVVGILLRQGAAQQLTREVDADDLRLSKERREMDQQGARAAALVDDFAGEDVGADVVDLDRHAGVHALAVDSKVTARAQLLVVVEQAVLQCLRVVYDRLMRHGD